MQKDFNVNNHHLILEFLDQANTWRGKIIINGNPTEIEIDLAYHHKKPVDWSHFESFLRFITKANVLKEYVELSNQALLEFGRAVFKRSAETKDWRMDYSNSIYYNGEINNNYSFSLIYYYTHPTKGEGDDYANYLADFESNSMSSLRRWQC